MPDVDASRLFVCKHTSLRYFTGVRVPQQAPIENKTNTLCNYANCVRFIYTKNNEGQAPCIVLQCDALHHDTSSEVDAYATTRGSVNKENSNEVLQEQTHEMCDCEAYHAEAPKILVERRGFFCLSRLAPGIVLQC